MIEIVLEMLTVTLNVPKLVPKDESILQYILDKYFPHIHNIAALLWARPVKPVCQTGQTGLSRDSQSRNIRLRTRSSDMFQRQTGRWTGSSDVGSDHPTLYSIISKNVLFLMFCFGDPYDMIFIPCISKTNSLLQRH